MCWGSVEYMVWYGWRTEGCFQHCVLALVPSLDTPILSIISSLAVSSSTGLACHRSHLDVPFRKFRVLGRGRGRRGAVVVRSVLCTVVPSASVSPLSICSAMLAPGVSCALVVGEAGAVQSWCGQYSVLSFPSASVPPLSICYAMLTPIYIFLAVIF